MAEELFLFTIAGVQQIIEEGRRMSDLVAGSKLLSRLSCAAAQAVVSANGCLVFPPEQSPDHMPNRFVARIPAGSAEGIARLAREAVEREWHQWADRARLQLMKLGPPPDAEWEQIWKRQLDFRLESYWASAVIEGRSYADAYQLGAAALEARKRTRDFVQVTESGLKDSLSGSRSAIRVADFRDARGYWAMVASNVPPSQLKPDGREMLDTLGAIKRFGGLVDDRVPSVSSVAAADFIAQARNLPALEGYREALKRLLGFRLYTVSTDPLWPYDGDLLFAETFCPGRLKDCYGLETPDPGRHRETMGALRHVYKAAGGRPSPYYGIIVLDGDGMGEWVGGCRSEEEHADLSRRIARFADGVGETIRRPDSLGNIIYAGGDDVLAVAPLRMALPLAMRLAESFSHCVGGGATASAGVALVHHLYPLDGALSIARESEHIAKGIEKKGAVGVSVVRRSGQRTLVRGRWGGVQEHWERLVKWFTGGGLSTRFAYDVASTVRDLCGESSELEGLSSRAPDTPPWMEEAFESQIKRLLSRHCAGQGDIPPSSAGAELAGWSRELPDGPRGLAKWLLLARFVAGGGRE